MLNFKQLDKNMPILVVDDFSTMRRIIRNCLKTLGFENIVEAEDGEDAWNLMQENEFKFIVSDWNMPRMMGLELLRAARASDRYKDIPFMIITAEGQKDNLANAQKSGVSNYIVKPFTAEILQSKMEALFLAQPSTHQY